jgi:tetratricopeptide (TPR) repeat protein
MGINYPIRSVFTERTQPAHRAPGIYLPAILLFIIVVGCSSQPNKERLEFEINQLEDELSELYVRTGRSDMTIARSASLRNAYIQYADTWKGDSLAAEYLFQAAMIDADIQDDVSTGIIYLERIVQEYPDHPITPKTLFLIGFTYAEQLNDYNKARDAYNTYLELFPDGEMAESVRIELQTLGLRPQIDVIPLEDGN